ncbi:hypothetical protein Tco_0976563 [Tanacetum coccineum]|uniref:Uncharacterized protein n=1 Tax=Tanacetum coccineum TaxID=301880 RepID=A0ABQ5EHN7_9ASTR
MKKAFQDMLQGLGEVNPTHAYYNGSCTSKDTEDPSWSTSFKTRSTQKTSSALEDFICVVFVPDRNIMVEAATAGMMVVGGWMGVPDGLDGAGGGWDDGGG